MKNMISILIAILISLFMVRPSFAQDQTVTLTTTAQGENLQQATDNALRSAIEQTFGAFISTRTEILNDDLVSDQIASVSSGNIQSFQVLSQTQLSENLWGVTVNAVVSVTKLTSFVQGRGVQVEIQGALFVANIRQQQLNEEAEIVAVRNMVGVLHELFQTTFDYEIEVGSPTATDATNSNWEIPITITVTTNENMAVAAAYFQSTMESLSLTSAQAREYRALNKSVFRIGIQNPNRRRQSRRSDILLRQKESLNYLSLITKNLQNHYCMLYVVDSGLDRKIGLGAKYTSHSFLSAYNHNTSSIFEKDNFIKVDIVVLATPNRRIATFRYVDQRTIAEINSLTSYTIKPLGVISKLFNP